MPYHPAELVDVVAELVLQVQAMRTEVAKLRQGTASNDQAELLRAIRLAMGDAVFSAAEALARTLAHDPQAALLRVQLGGRTVRQVGKLLASAAGVTTAGGLVLRKVGQARDGGCWHCEFQSRKHADIAYTRDALGDDD